MPFLNCSTTARKLGLLVLVAFLSLGAVMTASAVTLRRSLHAERELKTRDAVELAYGVLEHFHGLARDGRLGEEEAKAAAVRAIRDLRYEGQQYFWINDFGPRMIMHPFMPDLDGADLSREQDPNGKRLFVEFVDVARRQGAGFVEYLWPKPGLNDPVRKLSYVKAFAPWGWIVGTGMYLDDIDGLYRRQVAINVGVLLAIACVFGLLACRVGRSILAPLGGEPALVAEIANRVAEGDRKVQLRIAEGDRSSVLYAMTRMMDRLRQDVQLAEEGMAEASRLDAIGRLAGGIAHDFNNLLAVVMGGVDTLSRGLPRDDALREALADIDAAAHQAAALTRQLLAFGRREVVQPVPLDLDVAVGEAGRMLRRLVGDDVELVVRSSLQPVVVVADSARLQQVIVNLVLNARDAMPRGGTITIETHRSGVGSGHRVLPQGDYGVLAVRDTGCGMTPEVQRHIFEPFFTTKRKGRGTGLGLATVFGIVKQAGGHIDVESAPGAGSCFRIYLPCSRRALAEPPQAARPTRETAAAPPAGRRTILVVEDEPAVLRRAVEILETSGYLVVAASDPKTALEMFERSPRTIDAVLTDVVMPRMSGPDLADQLLSRNPQLRVVFMSGYPDDHLDRTRRAGVPVLEKPFEAATLLAAVGEALDANPVAPLQTA